jgi:arylsulfatase A-like enzyme
VRQGNWKYIHNATHGREELYDLAVDPLELTNLAAGNPELSRELRGRVAAWVAALRRAE